MVLFPFVYHRLLDTRIALVAFLAVAISLPLHDIKYGPPAALIAESFTGRLRYSGASLGYQLASIIAGGPTPIVATFLVEQFHSSAAVAVYLAVCAAISLVATLDLRDNRARDVTREYDRSQRWPGPVPSAAPASSTGMIRPLASSRPGRR